MPTAFTINPWGRTGAFAILMAWSLALFLLRSAERDRLTEWLSGQVVRVDEGSEYRAYRKLQMYAAAVEDALAYGEIGPAQRTLLGRLRESLEMSADDALHIESDLGLQTRWSSRRDDSR